MAVEWIDRQTDNPNATLVELRFDLGHVAKFGGAYRREILRVGEQYGPGIADPVVKADIAFGCLRLKIRRGIIDCKSHDAPPYARANSHRRRYFDTWPRLMRLSPLSATLSNVNLRREAACARKPQLDLHVRFGS